MFDEALSGSHHSRSQSATDGFSNNRNKQTSPIPAREFNDGNDKKCLENVSAVLEAGSFLDDFAKGTTISAAELKVSFKELLRAFGKSLLRSYDTWSDEQRDPRLQEYLVQLYASTNYAPTPASTTSSSSSSSAALSGREKRRVDAVALFIIHYRDLKLTTESLYGYLCRYFGDHLHVNFKPVAQERLWNMFLFKAFSDKKCYIPQGDPSRTLAHVIIELNKANPTRWNEKFEKYGILLATSKKIARMFKQRWMSNVDTPMYNKMLKPRRVPGVFLVKDNRTLMPTKIDPRVINVISGSSGSGKTTCSIMVAATDQNGHYDVGSDTSNVVLVAAGSNFTKNGIKDDDLKKMNSDSDFRDQFVAIGALRAVCCALRIEKDKDVDEAFDNVEWNRVDQSLEDWVNAFVKRTLGPRVRKALQLQDRGRQFDRRVFVAFDEMGPYPQFIAGLCNARSAIVQAIDSMLNVSQVIIITAGTGAENFQTGKLGSEANSYVVFVVDPAPLFSWSLKELIKLYPAGSDVDEYNEFLTGLYNLFFEDDKGVTTRRATDITTHRFLQLVSNNSRCAGAALELIHALLPSQSDPPPLESDSDDDKSPPAGDKSTPTKPPSPPQSLRLLSWPKGAIRSLLATWALHIVNRFAQLNGLNLLESPDLKQQYLEDCIRIVMNHVDGLSSVQWSKYAIDTGLLTDSAMWIPVGVRYKKRYNQVLDRHHGNKPVKKDFDGARMRYVYEKNNPRFRLAEAFVAMYLLQVGRCLAGSGSLVGASNGQLFEIALADYHLIRMLVPGEVDEQRQSNVQGETSDDEGDEEEVEEVNVDGCEQDEDDQFPIQQQQQQQHQHQRQQPQWYQPRAEQFQFQPQQKQLLQLPQQRHVPTTSQFFGVSTCGEYAQQEDGRIQSQDHKRSLFSFDRESRKQLQELEAEMHELVGLSPVQQQQRHQHQQRLQSQQQHHPKRQRQLRQDDQAEGLDNDEDDNEQQHQQQQQQPLQFHPQQQASAAEVKPRFAAPRKIFAIPANVGLQAVHYGILPHQLSDKFSREGQKFFLEPLPTAGSNDLKSELQHWQELIRAKSGIVLINAPHSSFADVIALAPNRIFLTQCKSRSSSSADLNPTQVKEEFAKMSVGFVFTSKQDVQTQLNAANAELDTEKQTLKQLNADKQNLQEKRKRVTEIDKNIKAQEQTVEASESYVGTLGNELKTLKKREEELLRVFEFLMQCCNCQSRSSAVRVQVVHTLVVSDAACLTIAAGKNWNDELFKALELTFSTSWTRTLATTANRKPTSIDYTVDESFHIIAAQGTSEYFDQPEDCDGHPLYPILQAALPKDPSMQLDKKNRTELTRYEVKINRPQAGSTSADASPPTTLQQERKT